MFLKKKKKWEEEEVELDRAFALGPGGIFLSFVCSGDWRIMGGVLCAFWSLGVLGCSGSVGHGGRRLCFLWLIFGFSPFAWDFPLGFVFFIFTVLFISGMVIMCVSDFFHFFGERVFGWPFFGWACVFFVCFVAMFYVIIQRFWKKKVSLCLTKGLFYFS